MKLLLPATARRVRFKGLAATDQYTPDAVDIAIDDLFLHVQEAAAPAAMTPVLGWEHTCVLAAGQLKCFGSNRYGQLGYGNVESLGDEPLEVGVQVPVVDLGDPRGGSFEKKHVKKALLSLPCHAICHTMSTPCSHHATPCHISLFCHSESRQSSPLGRERGSPGLRW